MQYLKYFLILFYAFYLSACSNNENKNEASESSIKKEKFGTADGKEVFLFTLKNEKGSSVKITNYGAIVTSLIVPDKNGNFADVVTGFNSLEEYIKNTSFFGATVGRYGNRIADGKFKLDGKEYQLTVNDGKNHLHGGRKGFYKAVWEAEEIETDEGPSVKLTYVSPDGEEGYPGTVTMNLTYTLTNDNGLKIYYEGTTDKPTVLNPTHHSYFNLSGDFNNTILDHQLYINSDSITPVDQTLIPTGKLMPVEKTPFDFRNPTAIGARINEEHQQLKYGGGYDHNWVINNYSKGNQQTIATLYEPESGRLMEIISDQPGLQFYSGNFMDGTITGKDNISYKFRTALCLEPQHFPDSPNKPQFPSVVLKPGETYKQTTIYKFSTK